MREKKKSHPQTRRRGVRVLALCVTSLLPLAAMPALASLPGNVIGEVQIVLGKAWIEKPGSGREQIVVGTQVSVHDRIDTGSNAHVHIRFVDNGLYSVRPQSTLEIQRYDYDPANPANSAVKLNLIEGVNRSISGEAASKARHNYRMNTPVAAIGVRGTDFVAIADGKDVEARINEGAIIVAPFSNQCLADALGPCSENGTELVYGSAQVLQIANAGAPVLLNMSGSGLPESFVDQSLAPTELAQREEESTELYPESVTTLAVNRKIALALSAGPGTTPVPVDPVTPTPPREYTPDVALAPQTLKNNQLIWGRFYDAPGTPERITVDRATAREGRRAAVGNGQYGLFRVEDSPRLQQGLGLVGFALNSAQATYKTNGSIELLDVSGGTLNIDFDADTFATSLNMTSGALGAIEFNANGRIDDAGYFRMLNPSQELSGAVSLDGREAGYYFEQTLESGVLDGLTLWGRQP